MAKSVFRRFPSDDLEIESPAWEADPAGQTLVRTAVGNAAPTVVAGFFEATGEGVSHQVAVAFTGTATTACSATVFRAAAVAFTGAANVGYATTVFRAASVTFTGVGTAAFSAAVVHAAGIGFASVGTCSVTASVVRAGSVAFGGTATLATGGSVVRAAGVGFTGLGTLALSPAMVRAASVTFAATSTFQSAATMLLSASITWASSGLGTFGISGGTVNPAPRPPSLVGTGYGRPTRRDQRQRRRVPIAPAQLPTLADIRAAEQERRATRVLQQRAAQTREELEMIALALATMDVLEDW